MYSMDTEWSDWLIGLDLKKRNTVLVAFESFLSFKINRMVCEMGKFVDEPAPSIGKNSIPFKDVYKPE